METKAYDLEKVYDEKISPLIAEIIAICKENNLPAAMCFQYKSDNENEYEFCNSAVLPENRFISEELERIWGIINERRAKPLTIKTKEADGKVKEITEIHT